MRTLLRKLGVGVLAVVVGLAFAGTFGLAADQAWAQQGQSGVKPPAWASPQSNQVQPIASYGQAMSQSASSQSQGDSKRRGDGEAPGQGTDNPRGCASPPCRHLGQNK